MDKKGILSTVVGCLWSMGGLREKCRRVARIFQLKSAYSPPGVNEYPTYSPLTSSQGFADDPWFVARLAH